MAIHNPPYYRYSLFEPWDKEAFELIKHIGREHAYPKLSGASEDKNSYLIALIRTQKSLHDWRDLLKDTLAQVKKTGTINTTLLHEKFPPESVSKEKPAWITYEEDQIVNDFIDELESKRVTFIGSDRDMSEFIVRFILGQLGHDWESTIMMIWELLGESNVLNLKELNDEMKHFDYSGLFS